MLLAWCSCKYRFSSACISHNGSQSANGILPICQSAFVSLRFLPRPSTESCSGVFTGGGHPPEQLAHLVKKYVFEPKTYKNVLSLLSTTVQCGDRTYAGVHTYSYSRFFLLIIFSIFWFFHNPPSPRSPKSPVHNRNHNADDCPSPLKYHAHILIY